jgi:cysteine synthase A
VHGYLDPAVLEKFPPLGRFRARLGSRLIEVPQIAGCGRVFAKCELDNPTATVKDRVACAMLWRLLQIEQTTRDLHVLEYSGGTLAVPLARLCQELAIPVKLVLSSGSDPSLIAQLTSCGASVELVDKALGFYAVMERAMELGRENPAWKFLYQHENQANLYMHETTTGQEILEQLPVARVDAWVSSIGTGGSLIGIYRALSRVYPKLAMHATTPAEMPYGSPEPGNGKPKFAGSGGLGNGIRQPFVKPYDDVVTSHRTYSYPDTLRLMRDFHREAGMWIGSSSAANLHAARTLAAELGPESVVVTLFPSAGTPEEQSRASSAIGPPEVPSPISTTSMMSTTSMTSTRSEPP